jgi:outer membrane protein assembly factor BamB
VGRASASPWSQDFAARTAQFSAVILWQETISSKNGLVMIRSALRTSPWLAIVLVISVVSTVKGDWTRFRGPNGSGESDAKDIPTTWSDSENLKWKLDLPGPGSSSPIIVGDRVFVTCYTGYGMTREQPGDMKELKRHLLCVDLKSGKILWDKAVDAKQPEDRYQGFICDHGYATSTPCSDGKNVFVFYGKSGVISYDMDGKERWRTDVGDGSAFNGWGSGASPIVDDGIVYVNAAAESQTVFALSAEDGKEVWKSKADNIYSSWSTPVFVTTADGNKEMVVSAPYEVWAFEPKKGAFLWFTNGVEDQTICGSLVARDGIVYAVGGRGGSALAIKAGGKDDAAANILWKKSLTSYVPSPVLADDKVVCINERGVMGCISASSGDKLFDARLSDAGGVYASPVTIGDKAILPTRRNGVFVIDLATKGKVIAKNKFSDDTDFNASPAVVDGMLLLRSNKALYAIGEKK